MDTEPFLRIYSIRQFNEMTLFGRKGSRALDHVKFLDSSYARKDHFLKMVISELQTTDWRTMYGLSIKETMELEMGDYIMMSEELARHTSTVKVNTDNITKNLKSNNKGE